MSDAKLRNYEWGILGGLCFLGLLDCVLYYSVKDPGARSLFSCVFAAAGLLALAGSWALRTPPGVDSPLHTAFFYGRVGVSDVIIFISVLLLACGRALSASNEITSANYSFDLVPLLFTSPDLVVALWILFCRLKDQSASKSFRKERPQLKLATVLGEEVRRDFELTFLDRLINNFLKGVVPSGTASVDPVTVRASEVLSAPLLVSNGSVAVCEPYTFSRMTFRVCGTEEALRGGTVVVDGEAIGQPIASPDHSARLEPITWFFNNGFLKTTYANGIHRMKSFVDENITNFIFLIAALLFAIVSLSFLHRGFDILSGDLFYVLASFCLLSILSELSLLRKIVRQPLWFTLMSRGLVPADTKILYPLSRVKRVLFSKKALESFEQTQCLKCEVIDDRVDVGKLLITVANVVAALDGEIWQRIGDFCFDRSTDFKLVPLDEVVGFSERGISARIQAVDVSIGDELYLIQHGVHLDPSDLGTEHAESIWIYVAIGNRPVARFFVSLSAENEFEGFRAELAKVGLTSEIISETEKNSLPSKSGRALLVGEEPAGQPTSNFLLCRNVPDSKTDLLLTTMSLSDFSRSFFEMVADRKQNFLAVSASILIFAAGGLMVAGLGLSTSPVLIAAGVVLVLSLSLLVK